MIPTHRRHPLSSGNPPSWAWGWGDDERGVFAEIKIGNVVQRMRWIFPGTFLMGSPESEEGRYKDEGPQHPVQITQGFWLADTPCTQELWQEVMGKNPSHFQSLKRPVENVSWNDCHDFLKAVEIRQPGLELRLPNEAEWEYACRAGTDTATWLGDLESEEHRAELLAEIAWYSGNSREAFDLEGDMGTHEVKGKAANPWGLFDMLGNIEEWCQDSSEVDSEGMLENYPGKLQMDPVNHHGTKRFLRGGSWSDHARYVRAAYRHAYDPEYRYNYVGFRLARGPQEKEPEKAGGQGAGSGGRLPRDEAP